MRKLAALLFLALSFALFGCKGPEGPAGPAGTNGNNGTNGTNGTSAYWQIDGFKDSLQCGTCHTADFESAYNVSSRQVQYETSGHRELGNYDRYTTACGGCHTNEGFLERAKNGFSTETYIPGTPSGPITHSDYPNSSPVGCFTCHSPHKRGNFTVRDSGSVVINTLVTGVAAKTWNSTASSNLCVKCHQPRMTSTPVTSTPPSSLPDPTKTAATDTAKIYSTRWNNHVSGEETQTLLGFAGVEFAGYTYSSSYHTTAVNAKLLGCEDCHMATPVGNKGGGHTFKVGYIPEGSTTTSYNFAGCNTSACHNNAVTATSSTYWAGPRNEIIAKLSQLGKMMLDTTITKKWSRPKSGKAVAWLSIAVSGTDTTWSGANASTSSPLLITPAAKAGALWNFWQVMYEESRGIHNTKYTRALLDASIAELNK